MPDKTKETKVFTMAEEAAGLERVVDEVFPNATPAEREAALEEARKFFWESICESIAAKARRVN
jgi:hypothetical protein